MAANRWQVRRRLGRDPVVIRPMQKGDGPARYLERTLLICIVVISVDVFFNAISPETVAAALSVSALRTSTAVRYVGLTLMAIGYVMSTIGVRQMGMSWRVGIDNEAPGPMVSRGLFSRMRHPIYSGMLLATTGMVAVTADIFSVAVGAAAWVAIPMQARAEEEFLMSRYPTVYPEYLKRTGRFLPRVYKQ